MIFCYTPNGISDDDKQSIITHLLDKYVMFFIDENDIIFSTETNQKLLRLSLKKSNVSLLWINSLDEIPFTPTQISELILFCINNSIDVYSQMDNLYFTKTDFETVYPTIFEIFRNKIKKDYIPY